MAQRTSLLSLPNEILVTFPDCVYDIRDYQNLAATSRRLRQALDSVRPRQILQLVAATDGLFLSVPLFLFAAIARELGQWARSSQANEDEFASTATGGVEALISLALKHCGLTMTRARELHQQYVDSDHFGQYDDMVRICVEDDMWSAFPTSARGGNLAESIDTEASTTVLQLAAYGELFGPDLEAYLEHYKQPTKPLPRTLSMETRLEFVKYCIPDVKIYSYGRSQFSQPPYDPRQYVPSTTAPYATADEHLDNGRALLLLLNSLPLHDSLYSSLFIKTGGDFDFMTDRWDPYGNWRQILWEAWLSCRGLDGLDFLVESRLGSLVMKAENVRAQIEAIREEPEKVVWEGDASRKMRYATHHPWLVGDLEFLLR